MESILPGVVAEKFGDLPTKIEGFAEERYIYFQARFVAFLGSPSSFGVLGEFELYSSG
jgi:hypothetical protein